MPVTAKIRFDFKADTGKRRFFWQRRDLDKAARELRETKVSLLKSLPFQGLNMAEFDLEHEVYMVREDEGKAVATDSAGNIFTAGGFYVTVDFAPTGPPCNDDPDEHPSNGQEDVFLSRHLPDGCW